MVTGPFPGKAEHGVPTCLAWLSLCVPGAALDPRHILAKPEEVFSCRIQDLLESQPEDELKARIDKKDIFQLNRKY